jgi:hypothetical protein
MHALYPAGMCACAFLQFALVANSLYRRTFDRWNVFLLASGCLAMALALADCTLNTHPIGHRIDPGITIVGTKPAPPYVAGAHGGANGDD